MSLKLRTLKTDKYLYIYSDFEETERFALLSQHLSIRGFHNASAILMLPRCFRNARSLGLDGEERELSEEIVRNKMSYRLASHVF